MHMEFIDRLIREGCLTEEDGVELVEKGLEGIVDDAKEVIFPMSRVIIGLVAAHLATGREKIAIYKDFTSGQRYVAADFLEAKPVPKDIDISMPKPPAQEILYKQLYLPFNGYQK